MSADQIAVTLKGEPVSRHIVSNNAGGGSSLAVFAALQRGSVPAEFGPGSVIYFWAEKPSAPDSLYIDNYVYRISVDPDAVAEARHVDTKPKPGSPYYMARQSINDDVAYSFTSPLDDPWFAARLFANASNDSYTAQIAVESDVLADEPASLRVRVAGVTDFEADPDHHVRIFVNGNAVTDVFFNGGVGKDISLQLPAGMLVPGDNEVTVALPGGTEAPADLVEVDRIELEYPRQLAAINDLLEISGHQK